LFIYLNQQYFAATLARCLRLGSLKPDTWSSGHVGRVAPGLCGKWTRKLSPFSLPRGDCLTVIYFIPRRLLASIIQFVNLSVDGYLFDSKMEVVYLFESKILLCHSIKLLLNRKTIPRRLKPIILQPLRHPFGSLRSLRAGS
jgi:hypothetical protein